MSRTTFKAIIPHEKNSVLVNKSYVYQMLCNWKSRTHVVEKANRFSAATGLTTFGINSDETTEGVTVVVINYWRTI